MLKILKKQKSLDISNSQNAHIDIGNKPFDIYEQNKLADLGTITGPIQNYLINNIIL